MPPLSILHLFIGSVPGGVLRYVVDIAEAVRGRGGRVVLAGGRGDWHGLVTGAGLDWVELPIRGGAVDLWRSSRMVAEVVRERGIDVIHAHHRRATLVARMAQWRLRRRFGRRPVLYTLHLTDMPMGFPWRMLSDFGDHCHAPSEQARRWLIAEARVRPERITLIPHGIHVERFPMVSAESRRAARAAFGVAEGAKVLAFAGRLEDPKNEGWCLDLVAKAEGSVLLVAGDGPNRGAFERRMDELHLRGRVKLLGERDPVAVYHASDLLVLPSAREGFSYACAEAMCCGVPVLRTRTAGTEEMILEGLTGRSCEIGHEAFVAAGVDMLGRDDLAAMGAAAAEHVRSQLTFERQVDETVALYERLAKSR